MSIHMENPVPESSKIVYFFSGLTSDQNQQEETSGHGIRVT